MVVFIEKHKGYFSKNKGYLLKNKGYLFKHIVIQKITSFLRPNSRTLFCGPSRNKNTTDRDFFLLLLFYFQQEKSLPVLVSNCSLYLHYKYNVKEYSENININLSNDKEFKDLLDRFYIPLCQFAFHYLENEQTAEDIAQECFVKLWEIRTDFLYLHQVKSFLYTSIRNKSINVIEHNKVVNAYQQKILDKSSELFFHDHLIEEETYRILNDAINKLPNKTRQIMQLSLHGMSNVEIADSLNISKETVHSLKKSAYKKLRIYLKEFYYLLFFLI